MIDIYKHYKDQFDSFYPKQAEDRRSRRSWKGPVGGGCGIGNNPEWLFMHRKAAISSFLELRFPTTKMEDWKYTNISSISSIPFIPFSGQKFIPPNITQMPFFKFPGNRLAFINGSFVKEISQIDNENNTVFIESFKDALTLHPDKIREYLTAQASYKEHAFTALNTAFMNDGAFIEIPKGKALEHPIYIINIAVMLPDSASFHSRNLIVLERNSQATVVEIFVSPFDSKYLTNSVSEFVVGENAILDHYKMQRESQSAFHISSTHVIVKRDASFTSHSISMGSSIARNEVNVLLDGEGGSSKLNGLFLADGTQHIDNHTRIEHIKPRCVSRELYKGVLAGQARGVFDGKLFVHKNAFKTDAQQVNKNLLLSDDAHVDAKPQLEIYADDVKCTHGANVGQLDTDALFYLRARGIPLEEAKKLLTQAFAEEVIDSIKIYIIKEHLSQCVASKFKESKEAVMAR